VAILLAINGDNMTPKKRPVKRGDATKWEVDFGIVNGHRLRPLVNSEDDADKLLSKYKKDLKQAGEFWARLSGSDRLEITATLTKIKEAGHTVTSVWADWQRWKKDSQQTTTEPKAYEDVVAEFETRKLAAGVGKRYVREVVDLFKRFGTGRERQNIHEISPDDLQNWLNTQKTPAGKPWSLSTKKTNQIRFSSLWTVAIAKGWASLNIIDRLEPIKRIGVTTQIFANATTLNIMAAIMSNKLTQAILAPITLGFFGCMRPEEIASEKAIQEGLPASKYFGWHDIDLKHGLVSVRVEIAKTGDERTIRLQPCAVKWLTLAKELGNPLPSVNERRLIDECCALIGLEDWIHDGLRKNCATHLRAVYKNDYDVIKDMGHSIRVLLGHYAAKRVPDEVSLEHWQITPDKVAKYLASQKWRDVVTAASALRQEQSPSENAKSES